MSREEWFESIEQSRVDYVSDPVDKVTEVYGKKPARGQVLEMERHKGFTYQRRGKQSQEKIQASTPKVPSPPKDYVSAREDFNVDLGDYVRCLKVHVPFLEVMKMEGQRNSVLQVIEDPPPNEASMPKNSQKNFIKPQLTAYQDAPVILQVDDTENQKI